MTKVDELRRQYQAMAEGAPAEVRMLYQGVLLGIDLCKGAAAEEYATKLEVELANRPATNGSSEPSWRKPAVRGTRNPNLRVTIYGLTDPRVAGEPVFYVGSAQDPEAQLADYIRADEVKVSAKPVIDEIVGDGGKPGIKVLEEGVPLAEANSFKEKWILQLQVDGQTLVNQRKGG